MQPLCVNSFSKREEDFERDPISKDSTMSIITTPLPVGRCRQLF